MTTVTRGDVRRDFYQNMHAQKQRSSSGPSSFNVNVGRVMTVDYENHTVTLKILTNTDQEFARAPVATTYAHAGPRTFCGHIPSVGEYCILGHVTQESDGRTTTPVILQWILPGTWVGHDWLTTQPFAPDEFSMDPRDSSFVAGEFQRVRHKLPHMRPGQFTATSAMGSDFFLHEDVYLANRRGNEIVLRDTDQALVTRAVQHFGSYGGTRVYSGMVQRDATFLPSQLFFDGVYWDGPQQFNTDENRPLTEDELRALGDLQPQDIGTFTPHRVFDRLQDDGTLGNRKSNLFVQPNLDPYDFLKRGLFVTAEGQAFDDRVSSDAVFGGKSMYRVSSVSSESGQPLNAFLGTGDQSRGFTEHRVELAHTWDGRLPVTEQTDGFDADRLPRSTPTNVDPLGRSSNAAYIENVMGTVCGNDPFSLSGRSRYGLPLTPIVFDPGTGGRNPTLEPAVGRPLGDQAATLFRLFPPLPNAGPPTFWSVTKDGRFFASIAGDVSAPYSAEVAMRSGLRLGLGGVLRLELERGIELVSSNGDPLNNYGLNLGSDNGALRLFGGGNSTEGSISQRTAPTGGGEGDSPSVMIEGRNNVSVKATKRILHNAARVESKGQTITMRALAGVDMQGGDKISASSKTWDQTTTGKATYQFNGPKDNLPPNGAFRQTTFTGIALPLADQYLVVQGDRLSQFLIGNDILNVTLGNIVRSIQAGFFTTLVGSNVMTLDSFTGLNQVVTAGNITQTAVAGGIFTSSSVNTTMRSTGPMVVSGTAGTILGGPGKVGGIVSSTDLDPLTGLPLATFAMGSPGHILGPPV